MRKSSVVFILTTLVLMLVSPGVALNQVASYSDVGASSANFSAINYLTSEKIVEGYADGTYKPTATINRAEFIKIAALMLDGAKIEVDTCISDNQKTAGSVYFTDVKSDTWYAKYVCLAKVKGLIKGYDDGTYKPEREISFAEASKIILMVFGVTETEDGAQWYTNYVKRMESLKAIPTDIETQHSAITRGQMAEMMWRISQKITDKPSQTLEELEAPGLPGDTTTVAKEAFPAIATCSELGERIVTASQARPEAGGIMMDTVAPAPSSAPTKEAVPTQSADASGGTESYSQTNVQVKGVDEADIVKNDGQYIYYIRQNQVRIFKAAPVENMVELGKVTFDQTSFYPTEMFLSGDNLVVIGTGWYEPFITDARSLRPYEYGQSRTHVIIVDVKDRNAPKITRDVSIQGNYSSSRRVGDYAYVVMNQYPNYWGGPVPLGADLVPRISDAAGSTAVSQTPVDKPIVECGDIHYFPGYQQPNLLIVAGIPVADNSQKVESEVILGASENVYSTPGNLYVASTDYNYGIVGVQPLIDDTANPSTTVQPEVVLPEEKEKTMIYKFRLDRGKVGFQTTGAVPGRILNQFSMDEYAGNFRIATTKGNTWDSLNPSTNNLYVLDSDLKIVGKIEDIAPGESIFSARFVGNRGYLVTFKKIDPLFVFDLSDPKNPKILGKLKIPGFSDYIHPYDENHIIGFGKDAVDAKDAAGFGGSGFAWYQGLKLAMFDVTNVEEPKQQFVEIIGDRGSDSDLLWNHKALLFDKEQNLMAFPVSVAELTPDQKLANDGSAYGSTVFQGAYVYSVDLKNGFKLRGKVTHYDDLSVFTKAGDYFYGNPGLNISRIIYIGNYLYSISDNMIKGSTLDTVVEKNRINVVD